MERERENMAIKLLYTLTVTEYYWQFGYKQPYTIKKKACLLAETRNKIHNSAIYQSEMINQHIGLKDN